MLWGIKIQYAVSIIVFRCNNVIIEKNWIIGYTLVGTMAHVTAGFSLHFLWKEEPIMNANKIVFILKLLSALAGAAALTVSQQFLNAPKD